MAGGAVIGSPEQTYDLGETLAHYKTILCLKEVHQDDRFHAGSVGSGSGRVGDASPRLAGERKSCVALRDATHTLAAEGKSCVALRDASPRLAGEGKSCVVLGDACRTLAGEGKSCVVLRVEPSSPLDDPVMVLGRIARHLDDHPRVQQTAGSSRRATALRRTRPPVSRLCTRRSEPRA